MTDNGTDIFVKLKYKVGAFCFNSYNDALKHSIRESNMTSSCSEIEIIETQNY